MCDLSPQVFLFVCFGFGFGVCRGSDVIPPMGIIRETERCSPDNTGCIIRLFLDILILWCLLNIEELEKFVNRKLMSRHGS